jgi:hypothetical protein
MTPERATALVIWWARQYTRGLPAPIAQRRIDELHADLHDHIAHERARGTDERRIAAGIVSRMVRGLGADASWHRRSKAQNKDKMTMRKPLFHSVGRVALVTALVLLVPLVTTLFTNEASWSLFDFALAAVLLTGTGMLLELAWRRPRALAYRLAAVAVGVAAMALGEADDAPGLVGFGLLLVGGTVAMTVRTARRS